MVKNPLASAGDTRGSGSIPGSGGSPGVGNSVQYSLPGKSHRQMGFPAKSHWQATIHGVTNSQMGLSTLHTYTLNL